jgi:CRISPR-associated protein Cas1
MTMFKGRLGHETARVPHADRHGIMWLGRGNLYVEAGTLRFATAGYEDLKAGDYAIPFQMTSCILIEPGVTISHDALRVLARHGTGLVVVGEGGVRHYASMPFGPDRSARARRQALLWADKDERVRIVRRMYAWRLGEVVPVHDLAALRGIEGAKVKRSYALIAQRYGLEWRGRQYDRDAPESDDLPNAAINHASAALRGVAMVAVAISGAIPQLGFIHEDSGIAFALDIADLYRETVLLPIAFGAVAQCQKQGGNLEQAVRRSAAVEFRKAKLIAQMVDRIKALIDVDDGGSDTQLA